MSQTPAGASGSHPQSSNCNRDPARSATSARRSSHAVAPRSQVAHATFRRHSRTPTLNRPGGACYRIVKPSNSRDGRRLTPIKGASMLTLGGRTHGNYCDGIRRRDFLKLGGLALGGLSLPQLLREESKAGVSGSQKAVIMVFLAGGPPHQDMFDLKPDAPSGFAGDYKPIATNVPGFDICEHMPRLAGMMDKFAVIRSLVGSRGRAFRGPVHYRIHGPLSKVQGGRPSLGAIVSKLEGPIHSDIPPFVGLAPRVGHPPWANPGDPGYLGLATPRSLHSGRRGRRRKRSDNPSSPGSSSTRASSSPTVWPGVAPCWASSTSSGADPRPAPAVARGRLVHDAAFDILGSRGSLSALTSRRKTRAFAPDTASAT